MGRNNLSANFLAKSLITNDKAIVLANWIVRTAKTLIHTVGLLGNVRRIRHMLRIGTLVNSNAKW